MQKILLGKLGTPYYYEILDIVLLLMKDLASYFTRFCFEYFLYKINFRIKIFLYICFNPADQMLLHEICVQHIKSYNIYHWHSCTRKILIMY